MHPLVARLVLSPDGDLKADMYRALQTELTVDDALNLREIDDVGRSWRAASARNEDTILGMIRAAQEREAGRA